VKESALSQDPQVGGSPPNDTKVDEKVDIEKADIKADDASTDNKRHTDADNAKTA
jgi:hypothetical protein